MGNETPENEADANPTPSQGKDDDVETVEPAKPAGIKKARRPWKEKFLKTLSRTGNVSTACRRARIDRGYVYTLYYRDPRFRKRWDKAQETAVDYLEGEAWKRAAKGLDKPVYQGGKLVGYERRYSDTLLIFLLKGRRPDVFGDKTKLEHSGTTTTQVEVQVDAGGLPHGLTQADIDSARSLLAQMEAKLPRVGEVIEPEQLPPAGG